MLVVSIWQWRWLPWWIDSSDLHIRRNFTGGSGEPSISDAQIASGQSAFFHFRGSFFSIVGRTFADVAFPFKNSLSVTDRPTNDCWWWHPSDVAKVIHFTFNFFFFSRFIFYLRSWYHGSITRHDAEKRLQVTPEGTFLVRDSLATSHDYFLAARFVCKSGPFDTFEMV